VKVLSAGKLDARAGIGCFIGYDSESKGYRIYWPDKKKISVERNVTFNKDDVLVQNDAVIIPGDALAEGEKEKIIQLSPKADDAPEDDNVVENDTPIAENPKTINSVPFPETESSKPTDKPAELLKLTKRT
jgi:hypothetical protein